MAEETSNQNFNYYQDGYFEEYETEEEEIVEYETAIKMVGRAPGKREVIFNLAGKKHIYEDILDFFSSLFSLSIKQIFKQDTLKVDSEGYALMSLYESDTYYEELYGKCNDKSDYSCNVANSFCPECEFARFKFRKVQIMEND